MGFERKRRFYPNDIVLSLGCFSSRVYEVMKELGIRPRADWPGGGRRLTEEEVIAILERFYANAGRVILRKLEKTGPSR